MSGIKVVHFAKFVTVVGMLDVILIPVNVRVNPEHDNDKAMSTEALQDAPLEAGLAWITLLLSSGLLGALFVWSLQNPSLLLPSLSAVVPSSALSDSEMDRQSVELAGSESPQVSIEADDTAAAPEVAIEQVVASEVADLAGTPLEKLMRQELATLPGLAGRVRYNPTESVPMDGSDKLLNRMFELLFLYIDSNVVVKISSADFEDDAQNLELSASRAQYLVGYLVDRGLDEQRFEIVPLGKEEGRDELPLGGHRVNVYAKNI